MRTSVASRLGAFASASVLAATALISAASPASAATSCYASTCQGKDPALTVCQNDARTVATSGWGLLELRYSPTCRAAWARFKNDTPYALSITVQRNDGKGSYSAQYRGDGTPVWTAMVNDKDLLARACEHWDDGRSDCTDWY
ncbi:DUF2690 domain-containing protein [Streptomyces sp. NPDC015130]|uniref:DUF2690 domain-containing protein n=1 Tax=Streptomyces sp. NPDC015130 TaxID=3364940 RepID=UPI0036FDE081